MPWKETTTMSLRTEFVTLASQPGANIRELCRRFSISPTTGYKYLKRYLDAGESGLSNQSRRPKRSPRRTPEGMEQAIIEWRDKCGWGGRTLHNVLKQQGYEHVPAPSTITDILRRHGRLAKPTKRQGPYKRFERGQPNALWQMDFKGDFTLTRGGRCYPLTAIDDHSRFNIILHACGNQQGPGVKQQLVEAFRRYGLPEQILCDRGTPWGVGAEPDNGAYFSSLEVWLFDAGVEVIHGRPAHPQTQGKDERFHRSLKYEVLSRTLAWRDLEHCQKAFDEWRHLYNEVRTHESCDDQPPLSRYTVSSRSYKETMESEKSYYEPDDIERMVKSKGEVTFKNQFFMIGRAFRRRTIAFRQRSEKKWDIYYRWKCIGQINEGMIRRNRKSKYVSILRPSTPQAWGVESVE